MGNSNKSTRTLSLCALTIVAGWSLAWKGIDASVILAWGTVAASVLAVWVGGKGWASYTDVLAKRAGGDKP